MGDVLDGWAARGGAASAKAQCLVFDERASDGRWMVRWRAEGRSERAFCCDSYNVRWWRAEIVVD